MERNNEVLNENNENIPNIPSNPNNNIRIQVQQHPQQLDISQDYSSINLSFFLVLFISLLLVLINSIELYSLAFKWSYMKTIPTDLFDTCYKYNLSFRTVNGVISFFASISCLVFSLALVANITWFMSTAFSSYLYYNYVLFGPYTLGFCVIGLWFWEKIMFVCEGDDLSSKTFSFANAVSLIMLFILSFVITLGVLVYSIASLYIDSVLRREEGSDIIRKLFWKVVIRNKNPIDFFRGEIRQNE